MIERKERQSNIELCRIFSIILVVLVHTNFAWTGIPGESANSSIVRFIIQAFSIIGVNVFVLITGYFSTTFRIKHIFNLLYICLFYSIIKLVYGAITGSLIIKDIFFISNSNWFVVSYIGLLILTPLVNLACTNKALLKCIGGGLLIYEFWFSFFPALSIPEPGFNHGYSVLSFVALYFIGRYIRLFGVPVIVKRYSFLWYLLISLILGGGAYFIYKITDKIGSNPQLFTRLFDYSNPLVILSAITFFLTFEKMNIGNKTWINHIARSTLAILLIHGAAVINPPLKKYFNMLLENYTGLLLVLLWIAGILGIFIISVLIDQIRLFSYKLIAPKILEKTEKIESIILNKIEKKDK